MLKLDNSIHRETVETTWNAGLFYNSLMSSLMISGLTDYRIQLNIYPGLLKIGKFSAGFWYVYKTDKTFMFGISIIWLQEICISF